MFTTVVLTGCFFFNVLCQSPQNNAKVPSDKKLRASSLLLLASLLLPLFALFPAADFARKQMRLRRVVEAPRRVECSPQPRFAQTVPSQTNYGHSTRTCAASVDSKGSHDQESTIRVLTLQDNILLVCGENTIASLDNKTVVRKMVINIHFASSIDNLCSRENRGALRRRRFFASREEWR